MGDWAEIRRLYRAEGMAIRAIARRLGISRNTVKKALSSHAPPRYERAPKGSIVDAVEPQIRTVLAEHPGHASTVIMERVGWQRGKTVFFERVQQLRPLFRPADRPPEPSISRASWPSATCGSRRWTSRSGSGASVDRRCW